MPEITRLTGHSPNTVREALVQPNVWTYKEQLRVGSKLDPFKPYPLLHHSHVVNIRGGSYQLKDKRRCCVIARPFGRTDRGPAQ